MDILVRQKIGGEYYGVLKPHNNTGRMTTPTMPNMSNVYSKRQ